MNFLPGGGSTDLENNMAEILNEVRTFSFFLF
jgi:hypothetical protein